MIACKVVKNGRKWSVITKSGDIVFTGSSRVSCFRYTKENGLTITEYQHGD